MRITVEIDENLLAEIQRLTGERKQSPAVARALAEYLATKRRDEFLRSVLAGETDYSMENAEVELITSLEGSPR
jgi:Arc/MetJ family transcription regulator